MRTRPLLPESARGRRPGALRRRSPHAQRLSERAGGHSHTACRVGGAGRRGRTGRRGWRRGARSFTPAAASDVRGVAACGTLIRLSFCGIMQVELTRTRRLAFSE